MFVKVFENGKCEVKFTKTHVGHNHELEYLPIPTVGKQMIATKIAIKILLKAILSEAHSSLA